MSKPDDEDDETQTWTPEPPSEDEWESARSETGYQEPPPSSWRPPSLVLEPGPKPSVRPNQCAVCGQDYVLRAFGECPHCQGRKNRGISDHMAECIRELRGGTTHPAPPGRAPDPNRERELVKQMAALGHPDLDGFLKSLAQRRASGK